MQFSKFYDIHRVVQPSPLSNSRSFLSSLCKKHHTPCQSLLSLPSPKPLILFLLSMAWPILDFSMKLYRIWPFVSGFSHLACFKVHPRCRMCQDFIRFYGWKIFQNMLWIDYFVCIHSSTDSCVRSIFWLVGIMLLWTFRFNFFLFVCLFFMGIFSWVYT